MLKKLAKSSGILIVTFILTAAVSCGRSMESRQLEIADAVMEEHPDSALGIIEAIDTSSISKERDIHLRELLLAQARVKLDYENIDTVPLARAQKFFTAHPEKNYRLRSNFYMGDISHNDSSFISATGYAADAFLEAKDRNDSYWTAKSAELISFILGSCQLAKECLEYDSIAIREYYKANKPINAAWAKIDLALDFGSAKSYHTADTIFDEIIPSFIKEFSNDTTLLRYALVNSINIKIKVHKYSELPNLFDLQSKYVHNTNLSAREILYRAHYLLHSDSIKKVQEYINLAKEKLLTIYDRQTYESIRKSYAMALDDSLESALSNLEMLPLLIEVNNTRSKNPVLNILKNKEISHTAKTASSHKHKLLIIIILITIILVIISIVAISTVHSRNKRHHEEYGILLTELESLSKSIEVYKQDISKYQKSNQDYQYSADVYYRKYTSEAIKHIEEKNERKKIWNRFYHTTKDIIPIQNIVLETLHDLNGMKQNDQNRIEEMEKRLETLLDDNFSDRLFSALMEYRKNEIKRLQVQVPGITNSLLKYFVFAASGFSTISIAYLLKEKEKKTYATRDRLIGKINASTAEDKSIFLDLIYQTHKGK